MGSISWKPSIGKSLNRVFKKAFNAIGSYKLFIPSMRTTVIDYDIKQNFEFVIEQHQASMRYLYDTDSDDDMQAGYQNNADIALMDQEVAEVMLECPVFVVV